MLSMGVPKRVRLGSKPLFWCGCVGFAHTVPFRAQECGMLFPPLWRRLGRRHPSEHTGVPRLVVCVAALLASVLT